MISRGQIYFVNLDPIRGREQAGRRPVLVVSADAINRQPKADDTYWEDLCFEIQQAAEKALKAVMPARGISFRLVHDLSEHLTLLEQNSVCIPDEVRGAAILSDYSVAARYPGPYEPVTESDFRESLKIAEAVVAWAEAQL